MTTIETTEADDITTTGEEIIAPELPATGAPTLRELAKRYGLSATYSPEDNKLRARIASRMPREIYDRFQFRARGFIWGRFQEMFHTQSWTPRQHDFLLEMCGGEIGDEETTLADRSEQRAERFVGYHVNRITDGNRAYEKAESISNGIPLGQPILVGHHSQERAERDAERIRRSLGTAVVMWERAEYWESRAARVISHADYKDEPPVRARRIETIEAEKRRQERAQKEARTKLAAWTHEGLTLDAARQLASSSFLCVAWDAERKNWWRAYEVLRPAEHRSKGCPDMTVEQVQDAARENYGATIEYAQRWINHCELRITYERAILAAQGGSHLLDKKPRPKQLPLLNYRAPEGLMVKDYGGKLQKRPQVEMTAAEFKKIYHEHRGTRVVEDGSHRVRSAILGSIMGRDSRYVCVFLTDSKEHKRPGTEAV